MFIRMIFSLLSLTSFQLSFGSYLGYPRIHFAGQFRADTNTRNNDRCNYRMNKETDPDLNNDWAMNGTGEFQFFNAKITSFVDRNGIRSSKDPIVNHAIIGNLLRPFAKLTDLDVDCQDHSTIYGLNFGITWNSDIPEEHNDIALYGKWTRNVIAQYIWPRLKCYNETYHGAELYQDSFPLGAQSTTTITNVQWGNLKNSDALSQLQDAAVSKGNLTVRVTMFYYTRNYPPYVAYNATLGYVVGVIGVPSPSDTLNVPGARSMSPTSNAPSVTYDDSSDLCYQQDLSAFRPWMNIAPFEVDEEKNEVRLDLSNSIPTDLNNNLRNIGKLYLGILIDSCVHLLSEESGIPYNSNDLLNITSGIYTIAVDSSLMDDVISSPLVVVQLLDSGNGTAICGEGFFSESSHRVLILLQEATYFLRPKDYYVDRLDQDTQPSTTHTLYVTKYGRAVSNQIIVLTPHNALRLLGLPGPPLPINGIIATSWMSTSDENGLATFEFRINATIPPIREYTAPPCLGFAEPDSSVYLPIDGQVYYFQFCVYSVDSEGNSVCENSDIYFAFLAFSDVNYTRSYTWKKDVEPIFAQFARMAPIMNTILNLSRYEDVTKSHSISLLNLTLRLDFENPSFMPTTRDLSPAKRRMILEWLEDPQFEDNVYTDPNASAPICLPSHASSTRHESPMYLKPLRCREKQLPFDEAPHVVEPYFNYVFNPVPDSTVHLLAKRDSLDDIKVPGRPLFGQLHKEYFHNKNFDNLCTVSRIKEQLQTGIQVEWATIPAYLTSLYSIMDGCNDEIYGLIRSIIMQEMLHMTQAANILIALNGSPLIDSANMTPSFPGKLPGGVVPNLTIHLEKLSLSHVHDTFMAIETPKESYVVPDMPINNSNLTTIGVFYNEISDCINEHNDSIFDPSTLTEQVKWPWEYNSSTFGYLVPVTNVSSAREAIKMIIDQGEGAGILSPDQKIGEGELAHFYKFEEIVCGRHLKKIDSFFYNYSGDPIPFNLSGVWPMRSNPSIQNIPPHSNCYIESRNFHTTYRKLLKKLQEVFNGHPNEIFVAVELMESLQVHAKKLMWTKFHPNSPDDDTTCGPVWEYEWPEEEVIIKSGNEPALIDKLMVWTIMLIVKCVIA